MREVFRLLTLSALACSGFTASAQRAELDSSDARDSIDLAISSIQRQRSDEAMEILDDLIDSRVFEDLDSTIRADAGYYRAIAMLDTNEFGKAYNYFKDQIEFDPTIGRNGLGRARAAYLKRDAEEAVEILTVFAERWPEELAANHEPDIAEIMSFWPRDEGDREPSMRMIRAVLDAGWVGGAPTTYSYAIRDFALASIEGGVPEDAVSAAAALNYAPGLVGMDADRRFDAIRDASPDLLDISVVVDREIQAWQQYVEANPRLLWGVTRLAESLRRAKRADLALNVIDAALAEAPEMEDGEPRWTDSEEGLQWLIDERSKALWDLGEFQAAINDLEFANQFATSGNQGINLAERYLYVGDMESVRALLPSLENLSRYGQIRVRLLFLMLGLLNEDDELVERSLTAMGRADHDTLRSYLSLDTLGLYQKGLIYAGEEEEALLVLGQRLEDPDRRVSALLQAQQYAFHQAGLTPIQTQFLNAEQRFYQAEEVQALIRQYGRVRAYEIGSPDFYQ